MSLLSPKANSDDDNGVANRGEDSLWLTESLRDGGKEWSGVTSSREADQ